MPPGAVGIEMKAQDIPFATDGLSAPTIFAEDFRGLMVTNGVAKLNLVENRVNTLTGDVVAVHVATLIIPANMANNWGKFLVRNFPVVEQEGADGEQA